MATITIPAEFRELFDPEARMALRIICDLVNDGEIPSGEKGRAERLISVCQTTEQGPLTVPASRAVLVALEGCIQSTARELPVEGAVNEPENRTAVEAGCAELLRWYAIAAEVPRSVRFP